MTLALVCEHAVPVTGYVPRLSAWNCARVDAPPPPEFTRELQEADSFISSKAAFSEVSLVLPL